MYAIRSYYAFLLPWAGCFAQGGEPRVFRWQPRGTAAGFLFLGRHPEDAGWELLGGEPLADSLDAVVETGAERAFWEAFLERNNFV